MQTARVAVAPETTKNDNDNDTVSLWCVCAKAALRSYFNPNALAALSLDACEIRKHNIRKRLCNGWDYAHVDRVQHFHELSLFSLKYN